MEGAKSTSESAGMRKVRGAVDIWVMEDKHGADLCNTMVAKMGKDIFLFLYVSGVGRQNHLSPVTWTPELSTDSIIVQPMCNLCLPLETITAADASS